jgi:hypothetical protein
VARSGATGRDGRGEAGDEPSGDDGGPPPGDLSGFGEFRRSAGPLPTVAAVLVAVVFSLGTLAWVFLR